MRYISFCERLTRHLASSCKELLVSKFDTNQSGQDDREVELVRTNSLSPRFFNAFDLISSGFNLSCLFHNSKGQSGLLFTSKCSASTIVHSLECAAKELDFDVNMKEYKVEMFGKVEGQKGKLAVTAEVFEVASELVVVEFLQSAGDILEYNDFCSEKMRTALKDVVWIWQGESN
ncbi:hypothetical protein ACFE04_031769 [Oxalis oulophora]